MEYINQIISFIQNNWAGIIGTVNAGAWGIFAVNSLVKNRKTDVNFDGLIKAYAKSDKQYNAIGKLVHDGLEKFSKGFIKVEKIVDFNTKAINSLIDLNVSMLSVLNVPLEIKDKYHSTLLEIAKNNGRVKDLINATLNNAKENIVNEQIENDTIDNLINTVDV